MRAKGVRMRNAVGTAGDEEAARGCGVALTIGVGELESCRKEGKLGGSYMTRMGGRTEDGKTVGKGGSRPMRVEGDYLRR